MFPTASTTKDIIAVAPFGVTRKDQHLIDDDEWYASFLAKNVKRLVYIAGAYSAKRLQNIFQGTAEVSVVQLPEIANRWAYERIIVRVLAAQLRERQSARVIFFGYSERMMLLAAPLLLRKKCRVTLVNTNNISQHRLKKYRWPMYIMHLLLRRCLFRFITHTEYEERLVLSRFPCLAGKTVVKKHHMMLPSPALLDPVKNQGKTVETIISCFGPITPDKSVDVLSTVLHQLDSQEQTARPISVHIYKIPPEALAAMPTRMNNVRISFSQEFMEPEIYRQRIRESDLVVMNHNASFEGKLSGIFCDCVALGVPYIALNIEPMLSFDKRYDGVGFLLPRDNKDSWPDKVKAATNVESLSDMRRKITQVAKAFEKSELEADYLTAFGLQSEKLSL